MALVNFQLLEVLYPQNEHAHEDIEQSFSLPPLDSAEVMTIMNLHAYLSNTNQGKTEASHLKEMAD